MADQPLGPQGPPVSTLPPGLGPTIAPNVPLSPFDRPARSDGPARFRELPDRDVASFEADWKAHSVAGPNGSPVRPPLSATFDQKQDTLTISFSDTKMNEHSVTLAVDGQHSVGRFAASHIAPGDYHLGDPDFQEHGAWLAHGSRARDDAPEGWASIPIRNADRANVIAASGNSGTVVDGADVMLHGGGSGLADPFAPKQERLVSTEACIRGYNADVLAVAKMVQDSGGTIPLAIESGARSLQRSMDGGKTWSDVPNGLGMTGTVTKIEDGIVTQHAGRSTFEYRLSELEAGGFAAKDMQGKSMYIGVDRQGEANLMTTQEYNEGRAHGQSYGIERSR